MGHAAGIAAVLLAFATAPGHAEEQSVSWYGGEYADCNLDTTQAIVACVSGKTSAWDRRLNAAYQALMKGEAPAQQERLKAAERAWVQFRNANCAFYANGEGTISRIKAAECMRVLTAQRAIELETAAKP